MDATATTSDEEVEARPTDAPTADDSHTDAMRVYGNVGATPVTRFSSTTAWRNPTISADGGLLGDLRVAAASVAGLRHQQEGSTGQDAFGFAASENGATVALAVADGLGSKSLSQVGSAAAVRIATAYLAHVDDESHFDFPRDFAMAAAVEINKQLRQFRSLAHPELDDRDLGTTLAFAWLRRDEQGWRSIVARIGDTDAFVLSYADSADWASPFERGDGALNSVDQSLPVAEPSDLNPDGLVVHLEPGAVLVLTTDGLSEDIRSSAQLRTDLARLWRKPLDANAAVQSIWYRRVGSHDDRTAAIVWIPAAPMSVASPMNSVEHAEVADRTGFDGTSATPSFGLDDADLQRDGSSAPSVTDTGGSIEVTDETPSSADSGGDPITGDSERDASEAPSVGALLDSTADRLATVGELPVDQQPEREEPPGDDDADAAEPVDGPPDAEPAAKRRRFRWNG